MLAQQRAVLVRTLRPGRRVQHLPPHPPEQRAQLQRLLQKRQQRRRVRAVPPPPVRRRRTRRRRIRHQRLRAQQVLVQLPEAAAADAARRARHLHRARQRVVPARVEDHHPQRRTLHRRQHVVERHRLEAHVGVPLQPRVHRHQVVHPVHLQTVAGVEDQRHGPHAAARETAQRRVHARPVGVAHRLHLEPQTPERRRHVGRVVARIRQRADLRIRAVAHHQRHPTGGGRRRRREQSERQQQNGRQRRRTPGCRLDAHCHLHL